MDTSTSDRHREKRKRSRSPYRSTRVDRDVKTSRSRSPNRHRQDHHRDRSPKAQKLPFDSRHLHKRDLDAYRPLLVEYLDLQKHLAIDTLSEDEVKGRWKSFLHKWNDWELSEGWYDPALKQRADERAASAPVENAVVKSKVRSKEQTQDKARPKEQTQDEDSEDDDGYGPALPDNARVSGPSVPNLQDLQHRQELQQEDRASNLASNLASLRHDRKTDRKEQKERLEELAPRADPGSRERQLEKKREVAAGNRAFADAKEGGADEVGEGDLMGDDGGDAYKRQLKENERRKNEREIRKEEVLRARAAEREERMAKARAKEDKTMEMLRGIAKARFGGGGAE